MPSFTIPPNTPITVNDVQSTGTITFDHPTYVTWEDNRKQRTMKLKQTYEPVNIPTYSMPMMPLDEMYSFDTLTNSVPQPCNPAKGVSNNKEHNMHINLNDGVPTDQKQRDYALGRLSEIKSHKRDDLRHEFGILDDDAPMTFEELMARIAAGKFTFPEDKKATKMGVWSVLEYIHWRDPSVKKDEDGFDKASAKLDDAYLAARDQVVLSGSDQGLKIIEDFKSATFH